MRILLTLLCSVMLWSSTCVAATFTTESSTFTKGEYTLTIEYPRVELESTEATSRANEVIEKNVNRVGKNFSTPSESAGFEGGNYYYTITYNGDDYISFITTLAEVHHGYDRVFYKYNGYIIDARTGNAVTFDKLLNINEQNADFTAYAEKGIYNYSDDSLYTGNRKLPLKRRYQDGYIDKNGMVCLLFTPYTTSKEDALYIPVRPVSDL